MSTHCYIGATTPEQPHRVQARVVLDDGHPAAVLPALAAIWARHARHDTAALITAILAHDWEHLDPNVTTTTSPLAGQRPVAGVGVTLASTTNGVVDPPEPVTVFPLCHARHLDAEWIYLLRPDTDTVTVHTSDGTRIATYPLRWHLPPTPPAQRPHRPTPVRDDR
ncbi:MULTISPECIES: hypothetical protein [unclassified Micromonospora]|uniref:hypothetical protein n=1 Tax=unclassified Micromonospora TaxID=2617518 RepID=UPI001C23BC4A|nr:MULTISPECIES: hypothetical protein [unclassified Micromonospora]MBU8857750.1 hypothetical protein [Micromonospora sp. WMMB482]MDM4783377.1 hypothetical protein [Micromonospora sp. b486]